MAERVDLRIILPVILTIELDVKLVWTIPRSLFPSHGTSETDCYYQIIGAILYSAKDNHFITRYSDHEGRIYCYDGRQFQGHSQLEHGATVHTHLCGASNSPDLPKVSSKLYISVLHRKLS